MTDQILGTGTLAAAIRHHIKDLPERVVFCAWDTPIKSDGKPDSEWVINQILSSMSNRTALFVAVITSQLPVGTCKYFEGMFPKNRFVVYPENVRAAHAVDDFASQPRIVLGSRNQAYASEITRILAPFTKEFIITDPETAEMVKHGLNGFLAVSITYAHELAELAKKHGANPEVLASALMSDPRIGKKAYLKPSGDMGAHLGREVHNLMALGGGKLIEAMASTLS
jgi:UDPglucose 6-dehydrogenase